MVAVKGNQPTLFTQLKTLPWAQVPVGDRRREVGHGRKKTRTVKALTVATPGGLGFPHARAGGTHHPDPNGRHGPRARPRT
jgi:hypothetical protein